MTVNELVTILKKNPVIPCTNKLEDYENHDFASSKVVLLYDFSIFDLKNFKTAVRQFNKFTIFSLETMSGIANDDEGVKFLRDTLGIEAVESSSPRALSSAKKMGMITVQTIFTFDSKSIIKATKLMQEIKPDFIDIRPGISLLKIKGIMNSIEKYKIICSGMISTQKEIELLIKNGATAVTTSKKELWGLYYQ
ncbi:MAG: glycerol-3-phosphate responsive antiterminator [Actinobacteria bacterium]|nr:glycerol-3-phosphate responsive antiterminator [Actinomycetota bacterium]